jgi:hypothetical protein
MTDRSKMKENLEEVNASISRAMDIQVLFY